MVENEHKPVLYQEALDYLAIRPNGIYVDGTFGRGGHARGILSALSSEGRLYAFDKDFAAIDYAKHAIQDSRFFIQHGSFASLADFAQKKGIFGKVDGLLLDLGVSSPQLETPERGFSFLREGPLDMRMDITKGLSAAEWINRAPKAEIASVLKTLGEEKFAQRIARSIDRYRQKQSITTTTELANLIAESKPAWEANKHPATKCFQAIRIYINHELADVEALLKTALPVMAPGGRICIISFHSLEDRLVKQYFRKAATGDLFPKDLPVTQDQLKPQVKIIVKEVRPSPEECLSNIRARSAVMRVVEKL